MTIGERMYYCRLESKMTQKELGAKTGIDSATIGKYERGVINPKFQTLLKIADALGVIWTDLMPEELLLVTQRGVVSEDPVRVTMALNEEEICLIAKFRTLTAEGRKEAAKRVKEVSLIPQYQKAEDPRYQKTEKKD